MKRTLVDTLREKDGARLGFFEFRKNKQARLPKSLPPVKLPGCPAELEGRLDTLENYGAVALYSSSFGSAGSIRCNKNTAYFKLGNDKGYNIGISHHDSGMGKLKIYDKEICQEFCVPIVDIGNPLGSWRIK